MRAATCLINKTEAAVDRLGLSPRRLQEINPHAILMRFDAYGGPNEGAGGLAPYAGYDDCLQAALGIMERFGGGLGRVEEHAHVGTIDVVAGVGGALATVGALLHRLRRRPGSVKCPIVARASLASLGMIVQYPFCAGRLDAHDAQSRQMGSPECIGEHALLHCYQGSDGEWLLICAALQSLSASRRLASAAPLLAALAPASGGSRLPELAARAATGDGEAELTAAISRAFKSGYTAAEWVRRLHAAGVRGATLLCSLSDVRARHSVLAGSPSCAAIGGPTFQFLTESSHPIGGPVTMFAPCAVRVADKSLPLPLCAASRYGEHTKQVLAELGIDAELLIASGAAATSWTAGGEYLPDFQVVPASAAPVPSATEPRAVAADDGDGVAADDGVAAATAGASGAVSTTGDATARPRACPVCLEPCHAPMMLSCSHYLCPSCAARCDASGHARCPVCRHPHLLDPKLLGDRSAEWRSRYAAWRSGGKAGSSGELSSICKPREAAPPRATRLQYSAAAGDLALAQPPSSPSAPRAGLRVSKAKAAARSPGAGVS